MGNHTETLQLDYDPARIGYQDLLAVFWDSHDPTRAPRSRQYAAIVFPHDPEQERLARASAEKIAAERGQPVKTEIRPYEGFTLAEDYHQKYYLQNQDLLMDAVRGNYGDFAAFRDSTSAARLNGYAGGYGDPDALAGEADALGLDPQAARLWRER